MGATTCFVIISPSLKCLMSNAKFWFICINLGLHSCTGDSGGPLIAQTEGGRDGAMYLAGVVSFGSNACQGSIPGVYTRVSKFMDWIIVNLQP